MSPFQQTVAKVENLTMLATMSLAVAYVISLTVICFYFRKNAEAFSGQAKSEIGCFVNPTSEVPTSYHDRNSVDVAMRFTDTLKLGAVVHIIGILGDTSYTVRIFVKKTQWFRLTSIILVSLYTLLWLGWLVWIHIQVFGHEGSVCRGSYLNDSERDSV